MGVDPAFADRKARAVARVAAWRIANPDKARSLRDRGYIPHPRPLGPRGIAKAAGEKFYFTGVVCKRGHLCARDVEEKKCVECRRLAYSKHYVRHKDRMNKKTRAYYLKNRVAIREQQRQKNKINPMPARARTKAWRAENPEAKNALHRTRRARMRNAEGSHSGIEILDLFVKQRGRCANSSCFQSIKKSYHANHIIPLVSGGTNWISNIQLLCPLCNTRKNATDPIEWAQRQGRLL